MNKVVITLQGENEKNMQKLAQLLVDMLVELEDKENKVMEDVSWGATMNDIGLL